MYVRQQAIAGRRKRFARGARGLVVLSLLAGLLTSALDGGTAAVSPTAAHADVGRLGDRAHGGRTDSDSGGAGSSAPPTCPHIATSTPYFNPMVLAAVTPERIDQGVDYAGSGILTAMGDARVTYVATDATGWPGAFIEYELLQGPDAGCYVFYAEGVVPVPGLQVGDNLAPGQPVATIIPQYPTGIELGWAAGDGTKTYAAVTGQWSSDDDLGNVASGPGKNFSALIASLGGPPGNVEG